MVLINARVYFSRARKILAFKYIYSLSILFEHASDIFVGIFLMLDLGHSEQKREYETTRERVREREVELHFTTTTERAV